jgi:hypothetical protein
MSTARLKRLQRLESRRPTAAPWTDPYDLCMALWRAIEATTSAEREGRPFSRLPSPEPAEDSEAYVRAMRAAEQMHERLAKESTREAR